MCKILYVFTVSQSIFFLEGLYSKLEDKGYQYIIICSDKEGISPYTKSLNSRIYYVEMTRGFDLWGDYKALLEIIKIIYREKPHIVHGHTPKAGLLSMIAAYLCGIKCRLFHFHGLRYTGEHGIKKKILFYTEKLTAALATKVFSVSESLRSNLVSSKICNLDKINVIENGSIKGIDIKYIKNIIAKGENYYKSKYGLKDDKKIVGFVGRICSEKGIYDLISAVDLLEKERSDFSVIICGPLEENDQKNRRLFEQFISKPNVRYMGPVSTPLEVMICFEILVMPTYREGFGLVNMEANAVGIPVITTNIIGCIDSIENGKTGILVNVGDTIALKSAMAMLLDNDVMRQEFGRNGNLRATRLFDREAIWDSLLKYYDSIIEVEITSK